MSGHIPTLAAAVEWAIPGKDNHIVMTCESLVVGAATTNNVDTLEFTKNRFIQGQVATPERLLYLSLLVSQIGSVDLDRRSWMVVVWGREHN